MKLRAYLQENNLTEAKFGEQIGASQAAVNRYCAERVPTPDLMRKIVAATGGQVTPNDFFEPPAANAPVQAHAGGEAA